MTSENFNTPKVEAWLDRLAPSTARVNESIFRRFMKWVREHGGELKELSPDDFIEFQMKALNSERYKILDLAQRYTSQIDGRAGYKKKILSAIKSFFLHSRAELPQDKSYIVRSEMQRVIGKLTLDDSKRMILSSNEVYQALFTSMLQGGMGLAEAEYWNLHGYEDLITQLRGNPEVIRVDLPGRKMKRNVEPYHTYIGRDAINALRNWLKMRPKTSEVIFTNKYGRPIVGDAMQLYWLRHLRKIGLASPRKKGDTGHRTGRNIHELRTLFRSQWSKSGAHPGVAEYFMGHGSSDKYDYDQSFRDENYLLKQYKKALPYLEIMTSPRAFGQVDEDEIEILRSENRKLKTELALKGDASRVLELEKEILELKNLFIDMQKSLRARRGHR